MLFWQLILSFFFKWRKLKCWSYLRRICGVPVTVGMSIHLKWPTWADINLRFLWTLLNICWSPLSDDYQLTYIWLNKPQLQLFWVKRRRSVVYSWLVDWLVVIHFPLCFWSIFPHFFYTTIDTSLLFTLYDQITSSRSNYFSNATLQSGSPQSWRRQKNKWSHWRPRVFLKKMIALQSNIPLTICWMSSFPQDHDGKLWPSLVLLRFL